MNSKPNDNRSYLGCYAGCDAGIYGHRKITISFAAVQFVRYLAIR